MGGRKKAGKKDVFWVSFRGVDDERHVVRGRRCFFQEAVVLFVRLAPHAVGHDLGFYRARLQGMCQLRRS